VKSWIKIVKPNISSKRNLQACLSKIYQGGKNLGVGVKAIHFFHQKAAEIQPFRLVLKILAFISKNNKQSKKKSSGLRFGNVELVKL